MSAETERHELYEIAKNEVGDRFAELIMNALPPNADNLATKDDVALAGADLRTEMADLRTDLRTEMADLRTDLRTEMADLRTDLRTDMAGIRVEMRDMTVGQTHTLMLGLVGSVTALTITQVVVAALG